MSFTIARSIEDALAALAKGARPIAGGSDLVVAARHGDHQLPDMLVAIDRVPDLASIAADKNGCLIGSGVTHAVLMANKTVAENYSALADAAALVGSPATRNVGTLGGNIMNASPAMDTGAPLVVLGATADLRSLSGSRTIAIDDLWTGPGTTVARADELCVAVQLPAPRDRAGSAYVRLEYRRAMEIAVVGAAAWVELAADGTVADAKVAVAAVAPTIKPVVDLDVVERPVNEALLAQVAAAASSQAAPISDLRASDSYRRHTVGVMASRAFAAACRRANGERLAVPVNRSVGIGASHD